MSESQSDSDEEVIGPLPPTNVSHAEGYDAVAIEQRAKKMRRKLMGVFALN